MFKKYFLSQFVFLYVTYYILYEKFTKNLNYVKIIILSIFVQLKSSN